MSVVAAAVTACSCGALTAADCLFVRGGIDEPEQKCKKRADGAVAHAGPRLRPLSEVQPRRISWLVPGMIPLRALTLVAGVGGLGKSTWLFAVAAQVSRGDHLDNTPADVILVSFEDPAAEVLRPRVEAAGGNLDRVHELVIGDADALDSLQLPRDVFELDRLVEESGAKLVVIDPIVAAIETEYDSHKDQHVRAILSQLVAIAERHTCAIAIVGHLNKAPSQDAYIRIASSVAFWNASRSVVIVTEDGAESDHRLIAQRKANWSKLAVVQRHRLDEIILPGTFDLDTGSPIVTSRMVFVENADDVHAGDLLGPTRPAGKIDHADAFLSQALADGDWHDSAGLKTLASSAGISERTLKRAAQDLEVEHESRGFPARTWWRLSQLGQPSNPPVGPTSNTAQQSQKDAPQDKVGPNPVGGTTDGPTARPLLGEPGYAIYLDATLAAGHITATELVEQLHLDAWIRRDPELWTTA